MEPNSKQVWRYFEAGPKDAIPIIMLHGAAGTAEVYYRQIMSLCPKGYRIVSVRAWLVFLICFKVQFPAFPTYAKFLKSFDKFIDNLNASKVNHKSEHYFRIKNRR